MVPTSLMVRSQPFISSRMYFTFYYHYIIVFIVDGDLIFFKFNAGAGLTAKKK